MLYSKFTVTYGDIGNIHFMELLINILVYRYTNFTAELIHKFIFEFRPRECFLAAFLGRNLPKQLGDEQFTQVREGMFQVKLLRICDVPKTRADIIVQLIYDFWQLQQEWRKAVNENGNGIEINCLYRLPEVL